MKYFNPLTLFLILFLAACTTPEPKQEPVVSNSEAFEEKPVRTYYYIPGDVAKRYSLERKVQVIQIEEATTQKAAKFYLNEPTQLRIRTVQLADYPISIQEVKNAEVDTSNIENFIVTVTPTDSAFQFSVYRDFSERNAIFSRITYDKERDSLVHSAFLMKKEMIEGILKFNVEKESNKR
ncbi:hypothetical protein QYS49_32255 [Marivirga salinae]|uniref:Lipoprotein n=1 Tax=Marivirga salinarum TaxID=3059078 RepID=A0AA51NBA4_9BACT|nr:hypothetical protein [Marivirga sp. BDSF4-3]WMN12057.1 hypothetical protein QYS49_32255 [Marivirga sp. BDSF4-3]